MVAVGPHGCLISLVHTFRVMLGDRLREFFHKLDFLWLWIFSLFCYMLDDLPVGSLTTCYLSNSLHVAARSLQPGLLFSLYL